MDGLLKTNIYRTKREHCSWQWAGAISIDHCPRGAVSPAQSANYRRPINLTCMFLDWDEAAVAKKNPHMGLQCMQT